MRRKPSQMYVDRYGPTVLTLLFIAVIVLSLVLTSSPYVSPIRRHGLPASGRFQSLVSQCTLPIELFTPPEDHFHPTGLTSFSPTAIFLADQDGRIGKLDLTTNTFHTSNALYLPPEGPTKLGDIAFLPPQNKNAGVPLLYAAQENPPSIIEINTSTWAVTRTFTLREPANGLAIVPSNNAEGFVFYASAKTGEGVWSIVVPFQDKTSCELSEVKPANFSNFEFSQKDSLILTYFQNQLFVHQNNLTAVYSVLEDGSLSFSTAHSLAIPQVTGFTIVPPATPTNFSSFAWFDAYVTTQNEKVVALRYNHDQGFEFC